MVQILIFLAELAELLHKFVLQGWSWVFSTPQLYSTLKDPLPFNLLMCLHKNATELPLNNSSFHSLSSNSPIIAAETSPIRR